tara:strand:- start:4098 stop:4280 length:183 start_codon:yes stop_codon:yes gene_type:complete
MVSKEFYKKNEGKAYKGQKYGTYYGDGLWGADEERTNENLYSTNTPLWMILCAFCCIGFN